jgi:hypothetical protein
MHYSPLAIKRHYILGSFTSRCDTVTKIPVYLDNKSGESIGYVDESLGRYADAFLFHLPEDVCKRLSTSGYDLEIDYDVYDKDGDAGERNGRIKLNYIVLTAKIVSGAIPRRHPLTK